MRPKHRLTKRRLKIPFDFFQRTFFQSADLSLGDTNLISYLHLGFSLVEAEIDNVTFTLSKLIPYWIIGLLVLTLAMVIAWVAYGLVPVGSIWIIYVVTLLFSFVMSGLGVSIANCSSTMQQSMYVMFFFIIIFQLMSGLMTPIDSMPQWAQYITYVIPPRYFIEIMRSVYLKGSMFSELWQDFSMLAVFAVFVCLAAMITYKKQS